MDIVQEIIHEGGFKERDFKRWCEQLGGTFEMSSELLATGLQYLELVKVSARIQAFKALGFSPKLRHACRVMLDRHWFDYRASCTHGLVIVEDEEGFDSVGGFVALVPAHSSACNASRLAHGDCIDLHIGPACLASLTARSVLDGGFGGKELESVVVQVDGGVQAADVGGAVERVSCGVEEAELVDSQTGDGEHGVVASCAAVEEFKQLLSTVDLTGVVPDCGLGDGTGFGYGVVFDEAVREFAQQVLGPHPTFNNLLAVYICTWRAGLAVGQFTVDATGVGLFISRDDKVTTADAVGQMIACGKGVGARGLRVGMVVTDVGACYLDFVREVCRASVYHVHGRLPLLEDVLRIGSHQVVSVAQLLNLRANVVDGVSIHVCDDGVYSLVELVGSTGLALPGWLQRVYRGSGYGRLFSCRPSQIKIGGRVEESSVDGFLEAVQSDAMDVRGVACEGLEFRMVGFGPGAIVFLAYNGIAKGFVPLREFSPDVCFGVLKRLEYGPIGGRMLRCADMPFGFEGLDVQSVDLVPRLHWTSYLKTFKLSVTFRELDGVLLEEAEAVGIKLLHV